MAEIGVVVTKAVRIDRDGARSLLRAFADWTNREVLPKEDLIVQKDVDTFLKRYADLKPEETE
jgi:hypothetical protein